MRLLVVRHGKAERISESGLDRDRQLRLRGQRQAEYLGAAFGQQRIAPDVIIASSFVRAQQTAAILARVLNVALIGDDRLLCDAPVSEALDLIAEHAALGQSPCFVGHNPQLEDLVTVLTLGPTGYGQRLRTGEAVHLELDPASPMSSARELARLRLAGED